MAKLLPGGFPELLPDQQGLENELRIIINSNYRKYGYLNIETPVVERNDILTSKGGDEVSKQIFGLYGISQGADDLKEYSLHFDLTVPLARYVVEHENDLKFPFKRFQMQKVFRGERQQKGRYKEFMQCDVDVIDEDLDINYDIEVIETLYDTITLLLSNLGINKQIEVHINNRKFIDSLCKYFGIEGNNIKLFYKLLDDFYKITKTEFDNKLYSIVGLYKSEKILEILSSDIQNIIIDNDEINLHLDELKNVFNSLNSSGVNVKFNPYITRGLDYYTGTVFETFVSDNYGFGSICSGGRFDNLVGDIRNITGVKGKSYGGVGGSIGLTRLFTRLIDSGMVNKKSQLIEAIIFNVPGISNDYRKKITKILRDGNISTDVFYKDDKLGKQFSYAENKNIPFGIFAGENEEKQNKVLIKDLDTRDTFEVYLTDLVVEINKKLNKIII